jgi:DNA-binding CsgD family transcriptional regulator/GAF domain-containing protein
LLRFTASDPIKLNGDFLRVHQQMTIPVEREMLEKLKESEEQYRIFASYQQVVSDLRMFYLKDAPVEQIIQKTLDLIIEKFGYYMAWYAELIEKKKIILPRLWAGKYEKYLDGVQLEYERDKKDAKCAISIAILTKKPFGYADFEHDKDFEKWRAFALQYGYRSSHAIPLVIGGNCKSGFLIYSTRAFAFSKNLVEYLKGIVDELATIIENITERTRAEEALQKAHDELEQRIEERTAELVMANKMLEQKIKERNQIESTLIEKGKDLKNKTHELEEVNAALKVLLKHRDKDKKDFEEKVVANVKKLVLPYVEKLKNSRLNDRQMVYLNIIQSNLEDIITPFLHQLSSKYSDLTPSEIRIAELVKEGKTTKEIAELLNSSTGTVDFHRNNLRKKLGLRNTKTNLRSFLLALT